MLPLSAHRMHEACIGLRWWHKTLVPNLTSKYISSRLQVFNPHFTKWGPMRPHFIINIYHSSHGWRMRSRNLSVCVRSHLECKHYFYITFGYGNVGLIFLLVSKSTPATKTLAMTVTTKIKTNEQNPNSMKTNTFMHHILPLIFKKSVVTIILNLWWGPNWPQQAWFVLRC